MVILQQSPKHSPGIFSFFFFNSLCTVAVKFALILYPLFKFKKKIDVHFI